MGLKTDLWEGLILKKKRARQPYNALQMSPPAAIGE